MNYIIYLIIFFSKIIENSLATLRLIIVSNGKKLLGAILQFLIAVVWIMVTGVVVVDIKKDPLKIVFFALGSFIGSYIGSVIEEKVALGNNMIMVISNKDNEHAISNAIRANNFALTSINGKGKDSEKIILIVMVPRKKRTKLVNIVKKIDNKALIISESANAINGGYNN